MSKQEIYQTPIDEKKLNFISRAFENLPKNGFSKLIVFICLLGIFGVIITSYVLLVMGYDSSDLIGPALLALGSELMILGAKKIFTKEQTIEDVMVEEIRKDLNDGICYPSEVNVEENTEENIFEDNVGSDIDNNSNNDNTVSTDNTVNTDNSISKGDVIYIGESNVYNTIESSSECKNKEENIEELNEDAEVKTQEKNNDEIENQNEDLKEIPKDIEVFDKTQTKKKRGRPKKELEEKDKNISQKSNYLLDWLNEDLD